MDILGTFYLYFSFGHLMNHSEFKRLEALFHPSDLSVVDRAMIGLSVFRKLSLFNHFISKPVILY